MEELWKDIVGYEGLYQVSNFGRVKSLRYNKIMSPGKNPDGYLFINLHKDKTRKYCAVHRLVSSAFIDKPYNLSEVNHKDSDKTNNNVNNLEWVTRAENMAHYTLSERFKEVNAENSGEGNQNAKLSLFEVNLIRKLRNEYNIKVKTLALLFSVSISQIERIIYNKQWNKEALNGKSIKS